MIEVAVNCGVEHVVKLETEKLTSELEGADLSEVVLHVQEEQNLLQLTFAAAARIFDQNLLDFLR